VLLYKSKPGHITGKLRSTWEGSFIITQVFPYGAVEVKGESSRRIFKVNGHRFQIFNENQDMLTRRWMG